MEYRIARLNKDDLPIVQEIAKETIRKSYNSFLTHEAIEHYIDSGQSDNEFLNHFDNCHVLFVANHITGFTLFFEDFIHLMMIDSNYHSKGYGSVLLAFAEETMKRNGFRKFRLETLKENIQAVGFYQKQGWEIVDSQFEKEINVTRLFFEKAISD